MSDKHQLREYLAEHEWSEETRMATLKAMATGGLSYSTTKAAIALIDFALNALRLTENATAPKGNYGREEKSGDGA